MYINVFNFFKLPHVLIGCSKIMHNWQRECFSLWYLDIVNVVGKDAILTCKGGRVDIYTVEKHFSVNDKKRQILHLWIMSPHIFKLIIKWSLAVRRRNLKTIVVGCEYTLCDHLCVLCLPAHCHRMFSYKLLLIRQVGNVLCKCYRESCVVPSPVPPM